MVRSLNANILNLLKSSVFIYLTIIGNSIILTFSVTFWFLEHSQNEKLASFVDALWWSFATATTVGYGDITPVTTAGKILGIFLMLTGTAIFASYTALFAKAILGEEVSKLERMEIITDKKIGKLEQAVGKLEEEVQKIGKSK